MQMGERRNIPGHIRAVSEETGRRRRRCEECSGGRHEGHHLLLTGHHLLCVLKPRFLRNLVHLFEVLHSLQPPQVLLLLLLLLMWQWWMGRIVVVVKEYRLLLLLLHRLLVYNLPLRRSAVGGLLRLRCSVGIPAALRVESRVFIVMVMSSSITGLLWFRGGGRGGRSSRFCCVLSSGLQRTVEKFVRFHRRIESYVYFIALGAGVTTFRTKARCLKRFQ